jgi:hypothetical protein
MEPMNERELGRKKMRNGAGKIRTGLCGLGKRVTENEVCINGLIYSPNERKEIKMREPLSRIHYNRNRGHVRIKVHQCDLSALQRLIIHSLQKGRNKKGARLSG